MTGQRIPMVEVRYRGGFAENLFQYCFGRLLAERWGHELCALPLPHFPGTAEPVPGRRYLSPFQAWGGMGAEERQLSTLMRKSRLDSPLRGRLILFGWFQRWEFYDGHEDRIRRWLEVQPPATVPHPDDLALCIRTRRPVSWDEPGIHAGKAPKWKMTVPCQDDIQRLLARVPHRSLTIFTDNPLCPEVEFLQDRRPAVLLADSFAAWNYLRSFRRMAVVLCHPSDWWAAFLSGASDVYALDPWHTRDGNLPCMGPYGCGWLRGRAPARPDLHLPDPRYHYEW